VILNYCRGFRGLQFSTRGKNKTKLLTEYERVTQKITALKNKVEGKQNQHRTHTNNRAAHQMVKRATTIQKKKIFFNIYIY
jgi:hypothetical protein